MPPWAAGRDPGQSAPLADWLLPGGDCLTSDCARERTFAVAELASFYGPQRTVGEMLRRMRCAGGCGGRVGAAWLVTGPILNRRRAALPRDAG
jgi:hypothetical protein